MHTLRYITHDTFDFKFKRNYRVRVLLTKTAWGPDAYKESGKSICLTCFWPVFNVKQALNFKGTVEKTSLMSIGLQKRLTSLRTLMMLCYTREPPNVRYLEIKVRWFLSCWKILSLTASARALCINFPLQVVMLVTSAKQADILLRAFTGTYRTDLHMYLNIYRIQSLAIQPLFGRLFHSFRLCGDKVPS